MRAEKKRQGQGGSLLYILLALIVLACFSLWYLRNYYRASDMTRVRMQSGVCDLTGVDLSAGFLRLEGDVSYLPGILTPEEFAARESEAQTGNPWNLPSATSRILIQAPDDRTYMITGGSIDFAHRVYVNGELRFSAGMPAEKAAEFAPGAGQMTLEVAPENGVIEIVQQGANFVHREGGGHSNLYFGPPAAVGRFLALTFGPEYIIVGLFAALFLVHLALYLVRRSYRPNLIFSLLCLTWMVRAGVTGAKVFYAMFPGLPWQLAFRAEYLSLPIAAALLVLLAREIFPGVPQKWFVRAVCAVSAGFSLLCMVADTVFLSWALLLFEGFFSLSVLCLCSFFAMKVPGMVRGGEFRTEHSISLAAFGFFMAAAINDALYHASVFQMLGFTRAFALTGLAMLIFSFFQMTAMFYGTMREVLEARRAEEESRLEAETLRRLNKAKEDFLHDLSHELQAPLTVVSGFAQLTGRMMEDGEVDREAVQDNMRRVDAEAGRMERLVTQLLDAAALDNGSFTLRKAPVALPELLDTVAHVHFPLLDGGGNAIRVEVDPGLPSVWGDRERLLQVLLNLVSNAAKHTRGGAVVLTAQKTEDKVAVTVTDTGEGIAPELLPHLFQRRPQNRAAGGNGLGLYIAAQIVAAHGGGITAQSKPGQGAAIRFTLPAVKEEDKR